MKQVYIEFAMRVMHWREKAGVFCGFTLLPSGGHTHICHIIIIKKKRKKCIRLPASYECCMHFSYHKTQSCAMRVNGIND